MNAQTDIIQLRAEGPAAAPPISWSDMGCRDHFVQFYENDSFLLDSLCGYISGGLRQGENAIVVATPEHRSTLDSRLREQGLDVSTLRAAGRFVSLDARETLSTFMVNGTPDPVLFDRSVGSVVRRATQDGRTIRAFGEMVALLWNDGNSAAAIALEELWNNLQRSCSFALFCAYPMSAFRGEAQTRPMSHVCSQHSRVIPAESYANEHNSDERLRAIALLQQKATSLEAVIAERRHAENAVREKQTRLAMAIAVAQLGIWELDLTTHELICSDQCKAHFGLRPDEKLTYERLFQLIHPDDRESVRNTLRNAIAINGDHSSEYRIIDPTGRTRWISSLGRCFHNGEHRMLGVTLDITDRKQNSEVLEQTVTERTARLKETLAELESFSYSISHDMRAPLRSMQGFAAILMEECADEISPEAKACLDRITAAAERMDRLIQDVLTFSRVARADFVTERVDLHRLVNGIMESYPNLHSPKATITVEGKLPTVLGNTAGLTQCLSNLLGNAVKFVAPGVSPEVRVWSEPLVGQADSWVRLYVKDNGIGIPPEAYDKIFEMFHRLSKKYDGTGIGLAIVKKAVERMGGKVGLTSVPGSGSTFWLDLRLAT
jgi:PAS domain S-box-containing protein